MSSGQNAMSANGILNIVVALPCEAKPLIRMLQLSKCQDIQTFSVYKNASASIYLAVSGVGKVLSSACTAFVYAYQQQPRHACFFNIGIAGSGAHSQGDAVLANKITDAASSRSYFPTAMNIRNVMQGSLVTTDHPSNAYAGPDLMDMEAAGFFEAARQCVNQEQIQVLKIVSDTNNEAQMRVNAKQVEALVSAQNDVVQGVVEALQALSASECLLAQNPATFTEFCKRWRFSVYAQHELKECLRRWAVVFPNTEAMHACDKARDAKMALKLLNEALEQAEYVW